MAEKQVVVSSGFGLGSACFLTSVVFAILKAVGVINWSWWLVAAPALGYIGLSLAITILILFFVGIGLLIAWLFSK